jgi:transposase-like protein
MSRSLADVDPDALSPAGRFVFERILWQNVVEDVPVADLAAQLKLTPGEIRQAIEFIGCEIEAQLGETRLPELERAQYEALRDDIASRGQLVPILVDRRELGLEPITRQVDATDGATLAVNLNRRHLTSAQKRRVIRVELMRRPQASNREIARTIGVDDKTVAAVRRQLEHLTTFLADPEAREARPPEQAKPTTVRVDEDLYGTLRAIATATAAYYNQHSDNWPDPELEALFAHLEQLDEGAEIPQPA